MAQKVPKLTGIGDKMRQNENHERPQKYQDAADRDAAIAAEIQRMRDTGKSEADVKVFIDEEMKAQRDATNEKGRRGNKEFTQVYPSGWKRLRELMTQDRNAARLYAFFCEHIGPDGTLCISRPTLAEALDIGERTVSRHVKTLEKLEAVFILKMGSANVYCLDPNEVWKSFDTAKPYAAFNTKTLVGKKENPFTKKRLTTILNGKIPEQTDMFENPEEALQVAAE